MMYQHCGLAIPWPRVFSPQVIIRDSRGCGSSVSENAVFLHHHEMPDDCDNVSPVLLDLSPSAGYKYCGLPQTSCRTSTSREECPSYGAHDLRVRKHHEGRVCGNRYLSPPDVQSSTPQQHQRRGVSSGLQLPPDHGAPWCHRPVSGTHSEWTTCDSSVLQYKASCLGTWASRLDTQSGRSHLGDLQGLDLSRCSPDTGPVGTGDTISVTKSNTELPHNMCACNTTNADTNPSVILRRGFSDQNVHTDGIQRPCSSNGNFQTGSYDHYHVSKETKCLKVAHALTAKQLSECDSDTAILHSQCCGVDDSNDGDEVCAKHGRHHAYSSKIHGVSHAEQRCQRIPVTCERSCPLPSRPAEGLVCFTRSTDTRDLSATHHTVSEVQNSQPHVVHQKNTSQTDSPLADINPFCVKYHGVWTVTKLRSTEPESPVSVGSEFRLYDAVQNLTPAVDFADGHPHISVCGCFTCRSNTYPRNAPEGSQWNKNGSPHVPQDRTLLKYSQTTYQQRESDNDEPYDLSMKNSGSRKERQILEKNVSVSVPEAQPTDKACLVSEGRDDFGNEAGSEPAARLALTLPSIPELPLRSSQAPNSVSDLHQGFVGSDMATTDMPLTEQVPELWLTESSGSGPEPCRSCSQKRKDQCSPGMVGRHEQHEERQAWNYGTSPRRTTFCFQSESGLDSPTESIHDPIPNPPTPLRVKFEHERSEDVQMARLAESPDPIITPEPDSQHQTHSTTAAMRTGPESAVFTSVSPDAERSGSYPTFSAPVSIAPRTKIHQDSLLLLQSVVTLSQQSHHKHVAAKEGVGHEVHVRTSTGKRRRTRPRRFRCHLCAVTCGNRGQLRGHLRTHTGERPYLCQEPGCHKTFVRNEELTRHRRIHSGERPYECGLCGKTFMRKDHLNKHVRMHGAARGGGVEHADTRG